MTPPVRELTVPAEGVMRPSMRDGVDPGTRPAGALLQAHVVAVEWAITPLHELGFRRGEIF